VTAADYENVEFVFKESNVLSSRHGLKSSGIERPFPSGQKGERQMPVAIDAGRAAVLIRKSAYEQAGLVRLELDTRFNLTDEEFRVEGNLVVIGPLPSDDLVGPVVEYLEGAGLVHFDDFFELSGNWPGWLRLYAM
jgi:hypothetical protein